MVQADVAEIRVSMHGQGAASPSKSSSGAVANRAQKVGGSVEDRDIRTSHSQVCCSSPQRGMCFPQARLMSSNVPVMQSRDTLLSLFGHMLRPWTVSPGHC